MRAALHLLAYAAVLATAGTGYLRQAAWPQRAPRLGVVAWLSLTTAVVVSVVLAGAALALPTLPVSADLAVLLHACVLALRAQYATPGGAVTGALGGVLALVVIGRCVYCLVRTVVEASRGRARQRRTLALVGRRAALPGMVVVEHAEPAVYCLPGWKRRVVVTTGALDALDAEQLAAVLAHERAHLDERHDLVLAWVTALARAFPAARVLQVAEAQMACLVEMVADDVAARRTGRLTLAEALLSLAQARTPTAALAAGGSTAAQRVRRLITPPHPLTPARRAGGFLAAVALAALPVLLVAGPAVAAMRMGYCPGAPLGMPCW